MPLYSAGMYKPIVAASQNALLQNSPVATHTPLPVVQPIPSFQSSYPGASQNVAGGMMGATNGDMPMVGGGYGGGGMRPMPVGPVGDPIGISNPLLPRKPVAPITTPFKPVGGPVAPIRPIGMPPVGLPIRYQPPAAALASQMQNIPMGVDQNTVSPQGAGQYF